MGFQEIQRTQLQIMPWRNSALFSYYKYNVKGINYVREVKIKCYEHLDLDEHLFEKAQGNVFKS